MEWAKKHSSIDDKEYETIMHPRRTLLYDTKGNMWTMKEIKKQFDVSMEAKSENSFDYISSAPSTKA